MTPPRLRPLHDLWRCRAPLRDLWRCRAPLRDLWRCRAGASALEFALIALPLVLFTFGIIEFARLMFVEQEVVFAADRVARVLYITPTASQADLNSTLHDKLWLIDPTRLSVTYSNTTVGGQPAVNLHITYVFEFMVPSLSLGPKSIVHDRTIMTR